MSRSGIDYSRHQWFSAPPESGCTCGCWVRLCAGIGCAGIGKCAVESTMMGNGRKLNLNRVLIDLRLCLLYHLLDPFPGLVSSKVSVQVVVYDKLQYFLVLRKCVVCPSPGAYLYQGFFATSRTVRDQDTFAASSG